MMDKCTSKPESGRRFAEMSEADREGLQVLFDAAREAEQAGSAGVYTGGSLYSTPGVKTTLPKQEEARIPPSQAAPPKETAKPCAPVPMS